MTVNKSNYVVRIKEVKVLLGRFMGSDLMVSKRQSVMKFIFTPRYVFSSVKLRVEPVGGFRKRNSVGRVKPHVVFSNIH